MRIFKFLAWDLIKEKMVDEITCVHCDFNVLDLSLLDYILMQYTGLHDNHGMEIYDGDICRIKFNLAHVSDEVYMSLSNHEVVTESRIFIVKSPLFNNQAELNCDDIEVIGNIYENPDLLKESER